MQSEQTIQFKCVVQRTSHKKILIQLFIFETNKQSVHSVCFIQIYNQIGFDSASFCLMSEKTDSSAPKTPVKKKNKTECGWSCRNPVIIERATAFGKGLLKTTPNNVAVHHLLPMEPPMWCSKFTAKFKNVLNDKECKMLIKLAEKAGFEQALINVGCGRQPLRKNYRNTHRVVIDSEFLARAIYSRIEPLLKNILKEKCYLPATAGMPVEFNERLRFVRYRGGEFFSSHLDGQCRRPFDHIKCSDCSVLDRSSLSQ